MEAIPWGHFEKSYSVKFLRFLPTTDFPPARGASHSSHSDQNFRKCFRIKGGGVRAQPAIPKNQPLASPSGEVGAPLSNNHPVTDSRRVLPSPHPPAGFPDPRSVPLSLWGRKAHLHRKAFLSVLLQSFIWGGVKWCTFASLPASQRTSLQGLFPGCASAFRHNNTSGKNPGYRAAK